MLWVPEYDEVGPQPPRERGNHRAGIPPLHEDTGGRRIERPGTQLIDLATALLGDLRGKAPQTAGRQTAQRARQNRLSQERPGVDDVERSACLGPARRERLARTEDGSTYVGVGLVRDIDSREDHPGTAEPRLTHRPRSTASAGAFVERVHAPEDLKGCRASNLARPAHSIKYMICLEFIAFRSDSGTARSAPAR